MNASRAMRSSVVSAAMYCSSVIALASSGGTEMNGDEEMGADEEAAMEI